MSERPVPKWHKWLWKVPLYLVLVAVVGALGFAWFQHDDMMRQQRELLLIDTQPHVRAVFDRYDPGGRGSSGRAWVLVRGQSMELAELWGVALVRPGQSIDVVVDPQSPGWVVPVYAREDLTSQLARYPLILDDSQMWAYQLTMPLTWMAGGMFGVSMVGLAAFRGWLWDRRVLARRSATETADDQGRGVAADDGATQRTVRRTQPGLAALVLAAAAGFLTVVSADGSNLWGMTAGVVAFLTLSVSGINDLARRPNPVIRKVTGVGYVVLGLILVGWTQARPEDLVGGRLPSVLAVRVAGICGAVFVVVMTIWVVRVRRRARAADSPSST